MGSLQRLPDTILPTESGPKPLGHITLDAKSAGKPYEGKPHVRFDEKALEIGLGGNFSYYASALLYTFSSFFAKFPL